MTFSKATLKIQFRPAAANPTHLDEARTSKTALRRDPAADAPEPAAAPMSIGAFAQFSQASPLPPLWAERLSAVHVEIAMAKSDECTALHASSSLLDIVRRCDRSTVCCAPWTNQSQERSFSVGFVGPADRVGIVHPADLDPGYCSIAEEKKSLTSVFFVTPLSPLSASLTQNK